jgi:hypothetical protein
MNIKYQARNRSYLSKLKLKNRKNAMFDRPLRFSHGAFVKTPFGFGIIDILI